MACAICPQVDGSRRSRPISSRSDANHGEKCRSGLRSCGHDACIPLDNNRAENTLRIVALDRRNFKFVQSEEVGKKLALPYSLVVSRTRLGVNPVDYLADVLERIDKTADDGMREPLPDR